MAVPAPGAPAAKEKIVVLMKEGLSREKAALFTRTMGVLRSRFDVKLFPSETTEDQLLADLSIGETALVLLPIQKYLNWNRIEGFWGLTRTSGPTVAAYFTESTPPEALINKPDRSRFILLDLHRMDLAETVRLITLLSKDKLRSGILPFLDKGAKIFHELWPFSEGPGNKIQLAQSLITTEVPDLRHRSYSISLALLSLWEWLRDSQKGYLEIATSPRGAWIRICTNKGNLASKACIDLFWPNSAVPGSVSRGLLDSTDFLRIHTFSESQEVEILLGYFPPNGTELNPFGMHTVWIEPLASQIYAESSEKVSVLNGPTQAGVHYLPFPKTIQEASQSIQAKTSIDRNDDKLKQAQKEVLERDKTILQMRRGGVATAFTPQIPDTEDLIETLVHRALNGPPEEKRKIITGISEILKNQRKVA